MFTNYDELQFAIVEEALKSNFETACNKVNAFDIWTKEEILDYYNKTEDELKESSYLIYLKEIKIKYDSLLFQCKKIEEKKAYNKLKVVLGV